MNDRNDLGANGGPEARRFARLPLAVTVIVALVAGAIFWSLQGDAEDPGVPRAQASAGQTADGAPATKIVRNKRGGYRFKRPASWMAEKRGSATITGPEDPSVVVTFGVAPEGNLRLAARRFLASVLTEYDDPAVREHAQMDTIGGLRSVTVAAEVTNQAGIELNLLVITIEGSARNYGITVFTARGSDPSVILPAVQQVVASFRAK